MRVRTLALFSCLISVALVTVSGTGVAKNGPYYRGGGDVASETWTFALYVSGDNNLEKYWDDVSLASLLRLPESEGLTIVAYVDRLSTDGTEVVEVSGASYEVVQEYPEMNFGCGTTFQWFLEEVNENYRSDKLAVVAWDHGYAWRYICDDVTSGGSRITMPAFQEAIETAGVYIDLLAFDACNMASVEVVYQVALTELVGIVVASEESVPTPGFPYDLMLLPTALDTSRSPAEMAADMVQGFKEFYEPQTWASTVALSAVSAPSLLEVAGEIATWADAIHRCMPEYRTFYKLALKEAYSAWCTHYHVDIADFGDTLLASPYITDEGLRSATEDMVAAVDGTVLASWGGRAAEDSRGMTLWWGFGGDWKFGQEAYADVAFASDMGWWAVLDAYN